MGAALVDQAERGALRDACAVLAEEPDARELPPRAWERRFSAGPLEQRDRGDLGDDALARHRFARRVRAGALPISRAQRGALRRAGDDDFPADRRAWGAVS